MGMEINGLKAQIDAQKIELDLLEQRIDVLNKRVEQILQDLAACNKVFPKNENNYLLRMWNMSSATEAALVAAVATTALFASKCIAEGVPFSAAFGCSALRGVGVAGLLYGGCRLLQSL